MSTPIPSRLHHVAYITHDTEATVRFYTQVLGLKLVSSVVDDRVPSTGDAFPYLHIFFELGDGSTIAFFEAPGVPVAPAPIHPAYNIFNHLALQMESTEVVDAWAERLRANGVEVVGPVDHGIIYSIYFYDPNNVRLEFTTTTDPRWNAGGDAAQEDVKNWIEAKKISATAEPNAIFEWVKEHRKKHKSASPDK
jgi:catechol 2,3-dioxygenase-like lactoylglutathione lyase family enzyme